MNERIRQLMVELKKTVSTHRGAEVLAGYDEIEKFAELIVRECMDVASPNYMSTPDHGVYYVEQAIDRIAEHFGVEE